MTVLDRLSLQVAAKSFINELITAFPGLVATLSLLQAPRSRYALETKACTKSIENQSALLQRSESEEVVAWFPRGWLV